MTGEKEEKTAADKIADSSDVAVLAVLGGLVLVGFVGGYAIGKLTKKELPRGEGH